MEEMARHVRQIQNPGIIILYVLRAQCYICMFSYLESNDDDCRRVVLSVEPYTYICLGDCTSTECNSVELQVHYPENENENYSVVQLTCFDGSSLVSNAVFMKDGMNLAEQVSVTYTGIGFVTFAFTQDQEGNFSCRSSSSNSTSPPRGLAGK